MIPFIKKQLKHLQDKLTFSKAKLDYGGAESELIYGEKLPNVDFENDYKMETISDAYLVLDDLEEDLQNRLFVSDGQGSYAVSEVTEYKQPKPGFFKRHKKLFSWFTLGVLGVGAIVGGLASAQKSSEKKNTRALEDVVVWDRYVEDAADDVEEGHVDQNSGYTGFKVKGHNDVDIKSLETKDLGDLV